MMTEHSSPLVDEHLANARRTPLSRSHIAAFSRETPLEQMLDAFAAANADDDVHAATVLALSIGAAGGTIPRDAAIRLLPDLEDMIHALILAGRIEGDRIQALLDTVEQGMLSWEREALFLFLATQLLEGAEPPRRLLTAVRSLAREPVSPSAALLLGLAVRALDDPEIHALAGPLAAMVAGADQVARDFMAIFLAPVLDSLTDEPRVFGDGYTVIRSEPKVGRNEPCPCGSGRKFKKCCAGKEETTVRHRTILEQFQTGAGSTRQRERLFEQLRPGELAHLNTVELTTLQLIHGSRALVRHRRWQAAERFIDALVLREDTPFGDKDPYRLELIDAALEAGEVDLAERHLALCDLSEEETLRFQIAIALARRSPNALELLESAARIGHDDGKESLLIECAFAMLDHAPALGILVARGCIDRERLLDSEMLLMAIDRARDRLGLPVHEPWWDVFDQFLADELGFEGPPGRDDENLQNEIDAMRVRLQEAQARVRRLDGELSERVRQLEAVTQEREQLATAVQASPAGVNERRVSELETERRRLRAKIDELKGEISAGAEQRASLRRELAQTADALQQNQRERPANVGEEGGDADEAEGAVAENRPGRILVPQFSSAANRSLLQSPERVAAEALRAAALLAAGDAHTWSKVKHMRRAHDVFSARIGLSYRLLFHAAEDRLEVLDLVRRRDLDAAIERLRRK